MVGQESTPLIAKNGEGNAYYFQEIEKKGSGFQSTRDEDGGKTVETLPSGSTVQDFAPRTLGASTKVSDVHLVFWCVFSAGRSQREKNSHWISTANRIMLHYVVFAFWFAL